MTHSLLYGVCRILRASCPFGSYSLLVNSRFAHSEVPLFQTYRVVVESRLPES
ncbi:MAG: hypothetical protein IKX13_09940 [Bacteroidales bacterium]|nr:hypothetical protein [Bacteroidales bacterium]